MKRIFFAVIGITLSLTIGYLAFHFSILFSWHLKFSNFLYNTENIHTGEVVVVKIDNKSLQSISKGGLGRWQDWDRDYYGQVITNLKDSGAAVIGIDIFFSESSSEQRASLLKDFQENYSEGTIPDKEIEEFASLVDTEFKRALDTTGNIVFAAMPVSNTETALIPHSSFYTPGQQSIASVALKEDSDNTVRKMPTAISDAIPHSLALEMVRSYLGINKPVEINDNILTLLSSPLKELRTGKNYGPLRIPVDDAGEFYINYFGTAGSIPALSFVDVYNNMFPKDMVKHKLILIGEMDAGLHDDVYVPNTFQRAMPGVEVHANAIETLLTGKALTNSSWMLTTLLILSSALITIIFVIYIRPLIHLPLLFILLIGYLAAAFILFRNYGLILNLLYPPLTIFIAWATGNLLKFLLLENEKRFAIKALSHYVSDSLASKLIAEPDQLQLGGEKKYMTVAFTDIADFTTISESVSPEELRDFLNDYFDMMTSCITSQEGTLDKYIGDAIMCFYGAPIDTPQHELKACHAALSMHKKIEALQHKWKLHPQFKDIQIRTGIATGNMAVGNFGSKKRFDYTVIGDKVNLASRIEGVNKVYGTEICISEETYTKVKEVLSCRVLDVIQVKGKEEAVYIYELRGTPDHAERMFINSWNKCFEAYTQGDFLRTRSELQRHLNTYDDPVAHRYVERLRTLIEHPPQTPWTGIYQMRSK